MRGAHAARVFPTAPGGMASGSVARSRLSPSVICALLIAAAAMQYLPASMLNPVSQNIYWRLSDSVVEDSGYWRYLKDSVLLVFSLYWPVYVLMSGTGEASKILEKYIMMMTMLIVVASIPFLFFEGFMPFLQAGIRWLILLQGAVGVFVLTRTIPDSRKSQTMALLIIFAVAVCDVYVLLMQGFGGGDLSGLLGGRLPGGFATAGTAGYFALGVGLLAGALRQVSLPLRLATFLAAFLIAATSGTRYAQIGLGLIALRWFMSYQQAGRSRDERVNRLVAGLLFIVPVLIVAVIGFVFLSGRGNPFDQGERGGRIFNMFEIFDMISDGDLSDILFGRGLGTGTNTAFVISSSMLISPLSVKWNVLIDNSFITAIIQLGLVGSLILFVGCFFIFMSGGAPFIVILIIGLGLFVQNIFEQFFLMIPFAYVLALDASAWRAAGEAPGFVR